MIINIVLIKIKLFRCINTESFGRSDINSMFLFFLP